MLTVPLTPFVLLMSGLFFGGMGAYMLGRALPVLRENPDGGIIFLIVCGIVFLSIAASAFWWMRRVRKRGYGWLEEVDRRDA